MGLSTRINLTPSVDEFFDYLRGTEPDEVGGSCSSTIDVAVLGSPGHKTEGEIFFEVNESLIDDGEAADERGHMLSTGIIKEAVVEKVCCQNGKRDRNNGMERSKINYGGHIDEVLLDSVSSKSVYKVSDDTDCTSGKTPPQIDEG